jgi:hypothetical protein
MPPGPPNRPAGKGQLVLGPPPLFEEPIDQPPIITGPRVLGADVLAVGQDAMDQRLRTLNIKAVNNLSKRVGASNSEPSYKIGQAAFCPPANR